MRPLEHRTWPCPTFWIIHVSLDLFIVWELAVAAQHSCGHSVFCSTWITETCFRIVPLCTSESLSAFRALLNRGVLTLRLLGLKRGALHLPDHRILFIKDLAISLDGKIFDICRIVHPAQVDQ